jgi:hypothetical protein
MRTPYQVQLACATGSSRPVVESHIASVLARGAGQGRYNGLEGAVLHQGMTVLAHNGAVVVRIRRQQLSKRAQKFRRLLGLKPPKINEINGSLVIHGIHNSMIFRAKKECPYKSSWIL